MFFGLVILFFILAVALQAIEDWYRRSRAEYRVVQMRSEKPSDIEWTTVASLRDFDFPPNVDRDECWNQIQGRKVQWSGKVVSVRESALLGIHIRMDPRAGYSRINNYDLALSIRDEQGPRMPLPPLGGLVTFTGVIARQNWNGSAVYLDDVELMSCFPPEDLSEMDWAAVGQAMSSDKTTLQREEQWNRLVAKRVRWSGVIRSVFDDTIVVEPVEFIRRYSEVWLSLKPGIDRAQLLALNKGDSVTFTGILTGNQSDRELRLEDAEIVDTPVRGNGIQPGSQPQH